jgi:hypothetical protein
MTAFLVTQRRAIMLVGLASLSCPHQLRETSQMETTRHPNRLINEKSPYLLQHAYNPVDWHPWGDEAFAKARAEDKAIFLSIGYSTCHWCHVMERESFENDAIAALMNELFVNIKVDREERPDVDKVYMTALQAMGVNGGWPMSMFLTPELKPFYGGTYFPPETRYGRIGFPELLRRISAIWKNERAKVLESSEGITKFLREIPLRPSSTTTLDPDLRTVCFHQAAKQYDPKFGGFGGGPKFPRPVVFNFLLRYFHSTGDPKALLMTEKTLRAMASGGMYDHIGGGFHRYSVDEEWRVPHFEKMLYDQAQIVNALVDLFLVTKDVSYADIIRETLGYVLREMTDKRGGFYSAEDADSVIPGTAHEKGEGAFYVWTMNEIEHVLGDDAKAFTFYYGVEEGGNALHDPQHEFIGKNILYQANSLAETAKFVGASEREVMELLDRSRRMLFDTRAKRPRPHLDDKIITAWNGLMISAFARASQALGEPTYLLAAERAAQFIVTQLYHEKTDSLRRRYREGEAKFEAHLDDYAFLTQGLLDMYETSFDVRWLQLALRLTKKQIELFWDEPHGGFFDTSGNDASILVRMKEQHDGAEPTGNSIAIMNLLRLSQMCNNADWRTKAERALSAFGEVLQKAPFAMPQMVAAYDFSLGKVQQIVIVGTRDHEETQRMLREVSSRFIPNRVLLLVEGSSVEQEVFGAESFITSLAMIDGKPTAYVCEDFVCQLPTVDVRTLAELLERGGGT